MALFNLTISGIDLPKLVMEEGFPLKHSHTEWSGNTCPSCGESSKQSNKFTVFAGSDGRWRYKCFSCGTYGDAADFLALARGIPLGDALRELDSGSMRCRVMRRSNRSDPPGLPPVNPHVGEVAAILRAKAFCDEPRGYLHRRCIADKTIDAAIRTGQLRMLPIKPVVARKWLFQCVGESLLRAAGMLNDGHAWPAIAFKPILAIEPGLAGFECRVASKVYEGPKALRYGTMRWPWYLSHCRGAPTTILVTEGFIDALSAWQGIPEAKAVLGVPGVNGWREEWFTRVHQLYPDTTILIGFDTDEAGQSAASYDKREDGREDRSLSARLDKIGLRHQVVKPPLGKDWNETLQLRAA